MSTYMRHAHFSGAGDVSVVSITTSELPAPSKKEVQVKILYSGFSGSDINMRMGVYPMQKKAPLTPGYCFVGRVRTNGLGSDKFTPGELVACLSVYDSEAEYANVPEKYLVPVPAGVDLQQATAFVLDWNTAYGMVYRTGKVQAGQRVFIHGLSGAVGYALFKLCQLEGAEVYGTASESKHAQLRKEGASPFVYTNKDWIAAMNSIGGAQVVFDSLGFESWDYSLEIIAPSGGIMIGYGGNANHLNADGEVKNQSQMWAVTKLLARNMMIGCPKKTAFFYIDRDQSTYEPELKKLFELSLEGKIQVPIKKVWTLDEIPEAHRQYGRGAGIGSMLVKLAEDDGSA